MNEALAVLMIIFTFFGQAFMATGNSGVTRGEIPW